MTAIVDTQVGRAFGRVWRRLRVVVLPAWRAAVSTIDHGGLELAGHLTFTALLSLFPFLIFLAALSGFLGDAETARQFIGFLFEFAPSDVAETLAPAITEVLTNRSGGLLTFGIVITIWVASSGLEALRLALNLAYHVEEPRPIWWRRLQSMVLVVISAVAIFVASVTVIFGPLIWRLLDVVFGLDETNRLAWLAVRYAIGIAFMFGMLAALHQWLPNVRQRWRHFVPGIAVTLLLWVLTSTGLSIYFGTLGDYSATYGTLGGVIITLTFFYFASVAFIYGAELNASLHRPAPRQV